MCAGGLEQLHRLGADVGNFPHDEGGHDLGILKDSRFVSCECQGSTVI